MNVRYLNPMLVGVVAVGAAHAGLRARGDDLAAFVRAAVSADAEQSRPAIASLREAGPAGLAALVEGHADLLKQGPPPAGSPNTGAAEWANLCAALDAVSGQRDCYTSRLYWYTDFEKAKEAARASGKAILSLRLLGKLTDEYSCANSRFFRTALYANEEISKVLRERFVLHWQSVRPVPRVTIDFGDGRKLERTVTGNSIHYVLDADGRVVDALPGLYGPKAFLSGLERAEQVARRLSGPEHGARDAWLASYHRGALRDLAAAWEEDVSKAGIATRDSVVATLYGQARGGAAGVQEAMRRAASKALVESPILTAAAVDAFAGSRDGASNDDAWARIAALHEGEARLDERSQELIGRQDPTAREAADFAISKTAGEAPLVRMVEGFERSMALDTVRNEYLLHRQIHEWFVKGTASADAGQLNERVYAELFLTPSSDPWLGLVPADTYTALTDGGLVCGPTR